MKQEPSTHRWVIDAIEEGIARMEQDGGAMVTLPAWLLPAGATERQILTVTRSATRDTATLTITVDAGATSKALAASNSEVDNMKKASKTGDAGGDVAL